MIKNRRKFIEELALAKLENASQPDLWDAYTEYWGKRVSHDYSEKELISLARDYGVNYEEEEEEQE